MAESAPINRKKFIFFLDNRLVESSSALPKKIHAPKSWLLGETVEDLLKKYEKKDG